MKRSAIKPKPQRAKTATNIAFWESLTKNVGCIACRLDGVENYHVSIHHISGRTNQTCHENVLPLCAGHHQDGCGAPKLIAVHPHKAKFEQKYGTQEELLSMCKKILSGEKTP